MKRLLRVILRSVIGGLLLLVGAAAILHGLAGWQERRTAQAWAQGLGPLDDLPSRFPRAPSSPAGKGLVSAVKSLFSRVRPAPTARSTPEGQRA